MKTLARNQEIILEITALSHEGNGIGRYEGIVVFVEGAAVGDKLKVQITKLQKSLAHGKILEIVEPSLERIENDCSAYPVCGGCSLRHISYEAECKHKQGFVTDNLKRIGKIDIELDEIIKSPTDCRYRNKSQMPVREVNEKTIIGHFAQGSHRVIAIADCLLLPEVFSQMANVLRTFMEENQILAYNEEIEKGLVRHLYLRQSKDEKQLMAVVVINGIKLPKWEKLYERWKEISPNLTTMLLNHNTKPTSMVTSYEYTTLVGNGYIADTLLGVELELSPDSFFQVNHQSAELLYKQGMEYLQPQKDEILVDLYCGVGAIGLAMAGKVKEIIGIEIVPKAIENAKSNAERNQITNTRFICSDAAKAAESLANEGLKPDIVVVDPPRKGVDTKALEAICKMAPKKLLYISCDSATLARDCKYLAEQGYTITKGRAVDLFPRTPHVETIVLMSRVDK